MKLEIATTLAQGARRGTIVFVHGAWCWNWYWLPNFLPYFASQGYQAVAFSLRGHGKSEGQGLINSFSIGDYTDDLAVVLEGLERPLIVGHSMGGFITQAYLARNPKADVSGAVLLASAPPGPMAADMLQNFLAQPFSMTNEALRHQAASRSGDLKSLYAEMFSLPESDPTLALYPDRLQPESYLALNAMLTRGVDQARQIATPLLVLGAGQDRLVSPKAVAGTAKFYNTTPIIFEEMSHMMMLEPRWQMVADTIIKFADALPR